MLGAMLRPTSGSVVDGIDLATAPERELPTLRSRHLGFVFQDFNVLSALSAWENVELACNLGGTTGSKARDRAAHLGAGDAVDAFQKAAQQRGGPDREVILLLHPRDGRRRAAGKKPAEHLTGHTPVGPKSVVEGE